METHKTLIPAIILITALLLLLAPPEGVAQTAAGGSLENFWVPQSRAYSLGQTSGASVTHVQARVEIDDRLVQTSLWFHLENPLPSQQEGTFLAPLPEGAVVKEFAFQGSARESRFEILPREEAGRTYEEIVARLRDPAILEFTGHHCLRSSVFPIPPRGKQTIRIVFESFLQGDGTRLDYVLPRSESIDYRIPWDISLVIRSSELITAVFSPSHPVQTTPGSRGEIFVALCPSGRLEPGPFRLSILTAGQKAISASLQAYPDPAAGGGYFLLLVGLPPMLSREPIKREITLVVDRSGSMAGEKIAQVKEAGRRILDCLAPGEAFNLISYNQRVDCLAPQSLTVTQTNLELGRRFLDGLIPRGGTNIHDGLLEALLRPPAPGLLPLVIFLTDGLPTLGQTSEKAIRALTAQANPHGRRIFTLGVGPDINTPLLSSLARKSRGQAFFVLPGERLDARLTDLFQGLAGPILSDPVLICRPDPSRIVDPLPMVLPDCYAGEPIVVLGRYRERAPLSFTLLGESPGGPQTYTFSLSLDRASTRNAHVPRLWASRKIASLADEIRESGADNPTGDPATTERVREIVRLSRQFGILSEYTAFLAREGTDLYSEDRVLAEALNRFRKRALSVRSGMASMNQELNLIAQRGEARLNLRNHFYNDRLQSVEVASMQQINDRAFVRRNNRWVDTRLEPRSGGIRPDRIVASGSADFRELLQRLVVQDRQGTLSLNGEIMMLVEGEVILIHP